MSTTTVITASTLTTSAIESWITFTQECISEPGGETFCAEPATTDIVKRADTFFTMSARSPAAPTDTPSSSLSNYGIKTGHGNPVIIAVIIAIILALAIFTFVVLIVLVCICKKRGKKKAGKNGV